MALRSQRRRMVNRRYISEDFTSIFTEKKNLLSSISEPCIEETVVEETVVDDQGMQLEGAMEEVIYTQVSTLYILYLSGQYVTASLPNILLKLSRV